MTAAYESFLASKVRRAQSVGFDVSGDDLSPRLFHFQRDIVRWAIKKGRAAIFADTGLGKSAMQIEWARHVNAHTQGRVLILAPLAVAAQTVREGERVGVVVTHCREPEDVRDGVNITNYDRLHKFDTRQFTGVVLDESSIVKNFASKTLGVLLDAFGQTPFRLAATATPSPNDYTELGTHSEFLGVRSRVDMLSEFFGHDGGDTGVFRLKGHARGEFWRWVASWAALMRRPSDLGYSDDGYVLPALHVHEHTIASDAETLRNMGVLFAENAATLTERRGARKASVGARVKACADMVNGEPHEPWIVWCDLNAESNALAKAIPGSVEVQGSDDADVKEQAMIDFATGRIRVLVSKASICGFGLNWQHCARMAFVGVNDSFEGYYQAVRRCYRFGQKREVVVHIFASDAEGAVVANLKRKERDAIAMAEELTVETREAVLGELRGAASHEKDSYNPDAAMVIPSWLRSENA